MMDRYATFTRTWWDGKGEPEVGRRNYQRRSTYATEDEAREACKAWNNTHPPGPRSRKMEYDER